MRVLIAAPHLGLVGGIESYLHSIMPRLAAMGFELALLAEQGDSHGGITSGCRGIPVWNATETPFHTIIKEVTDWKPAVVYDNGLTDDRLESELVRRFPTILFGHNYHGTCISGTKCHSFPRNASCHREFGLACLALYLPRGCGSWNPLRMISLYAGQQRRRANLDAFRAVLVASRHMAGEFRRHGVGDDRLQVVPLFPTDAVPDATPPAKRSRTNRVLFVGRITRLKGLTDLIEALPKAEAELGRRLSLVVAGDGPERASAEMQARRHGLAAEFLGWISAERRTAEMRLADTLAVPSVWPEPFGLVGLEAGCVGLPAVGYATGGIPDWLIAGVTGESAPGEQPEPAALSAALVRALRDEEHLHQLRVGAWQMSKRFSVEAHCQSLVEILQQFHPSNQDGEAIRLSVKSGRHRN
jgi:glycosyltransferase involved in cell wall biosynthesis